MQYKQLFIGFEPRQPRHSFLYLSMTYIFFGVSGCLTGAYWVPNTQTIVKKASVLSFSLILQLHVFK